MAAEESAAAAYEEETQEHQIEKVSKDGNVRQKQRESRCSSSKEKEKEKRQQQRESRCSSSSDSVGTADAQVALEIQTYWQNVKTIVAQADVLEDVFAELALPIKSAQGFYDQKYFIARQTKSAEQFHDQQQFKVIQKKTGSGSQGVRQKHTVTVEFKDGVLQMQCEKQTSQESKEQ